MWRGVRALCGADQSAWGGNAPLPVSLCTHQATAWARAAFCCSARGEVHTQRATQHGCFMLFYSRPFRALSAISGLLSHVSKIDCFGDEGLRLGRDSGEQLPLMGHWKHSSSHVLRVYKSMSYMFYRSAACLSTAASLAQWFGWGEAGRGVTVPYFASLGLACFARELCTAHGGSPPPSLHYCWVGHSRPLLQVVWAALASKQVLGVMPVAFSPSLHR